MSKITKKERIKELERQVRGLTVLFSSLNTWSEYADSMLTELNHALPDPEYDAECEADEPAINASLDRHRERLGLNKPQLKQLDQSVFDGLDEKWRFAARCLSGKAIATKCEPKIILNGYSCEDGYLLVGTGYDTSNWQNSLIERDIAKELLEVDLSSELTGSELCKAMLERGDKFVMCMAGDGTDVIYDLACFVSSTHPYIGRLDSYRAVTPINNQGKQLTAAEVGL